MKKYKINDSPEFDSKRTLAKWIKITISDETIADGVEFSDGEMKLFIDDKDLLFRVLEAE
jgi:hypothetical protein